MGTTNKIIRTVKDRMADVITKAVENDSVSVERETLPQDVAEAVVENADMERVFKCASKIRDIRETDVLEYDESLTVREAIERETKLWLAGKAQEEMGDLVKDDDRVAEVLGIDDGEGAE